MAKAQKPTLEKTLGTVAVMLSTTPEEVRSFLLKASVEDLLAVKDAYGVFGVAIKAKYAHLGSDAVIGNMSEEDQKAAKTAVVMASLGIPAPAADLSEIIAELEAHGLELASSAAAEAISKASAA